MKTRFLVLSVLILTIAVFSPLLSGCVPYITGGRQSYNKALPPKYFPPEKIGNNIEIGLASWYGPGYQGRPTASGRIFNMYDITAASKTLPLDCYAYVTDLQNKRSVEVFVDDRGPYYGDRILDLSYGAAKALDMVGPGTALVRVQYLGPRPVSLSYLNNNITGAPTCARTKKGNSIFIPPKKGYTLQFAAFTEKSLADAKARKVGKFVPGVRVMDKKVNGEVYYKVVFGRFKDLGNAYNFAKVIVKYGYDVYITRID